MPDRVQVCRNYIDLRRDDSCTQSDWERSSARAGAIDAISDGWGEEATARFSPTFSLVSTIQIFSRVRFRNLTMTRSFMDSANRTFFWHVSDLASQGYSSGGRIASYLYHDAFHVGQFLEGDRAPETDQLVRREVEATDAQLDLARVACSDDLPFLSFLTNYRNDPDAIRARLSSGVSWMESVFLGRPRYVPHLTIFE